MEVIRQGEIGGGESHLIDLVRDLKARHIHLIVVAFSDGNMIENMRRMGITTYVVHTTRPFDLSVIKRMRQIVKDERINLIHAHGSRAASNVITLFTSQRIPLIYTVHGWSFHQDQNKVVHFLRAMSEKLICHFSRKVICVSADNARSGEKAFGLSRQKTVVIENGINLNIFDPEKHSGIRHQLQIPADEFIVGFIGRATLQKDPISFIESIRIAHGQVPAIKGLFVGEGEMDNEITDYIETHHLQDIIYRFPFRTDVPDILGSIDIYSLCSLWEGLSIGLLEAMAMKKAIIATPTDGSRTVITHRENGFILPYRNPNAMAQQIVELYQNPQLIKQAGDAARLLVKKKFDSKRVADAVYEIYNHK